SRRRHTRFSRDWSSDVCSSDLDQVRALLRQRQQEQLRKVAEREAAEKSKQQQQQQQQQQRPQNVQERLRKLRKELNTLVALHHHRTKKPHGVIYKELQRVCGGPPTAMASIEQLEERIATLRSW